MNDEVKSRPSLTAAELLVRQQTRLNRARLRVKLKSLAAEAKLIRSEELRWKHDTFVRAELHHHRTLDVRLEARAAHLVYGLSRGLPLHRLESRVKGFDPTNKKHLRQAYPEHLKQRLVSLVKKYTTLQRLELPQELRLQLTS